MNEKQMAQTTETTASSTTTPFTAAQTNTEPARTAQTNAKQTDDTLARAQSISAQTEVIPFLSLNGKAAEAIAFYEQLGATVLLKVTYAQLAAMDDSFHVQPGQEQHITHSILQFGSNKLMIAEASVELEQPWQHGSSFSLCLQSRQHEHMELLYHHMIADARCNIIVPFAPNSFSSGYAAVRDPFGVVFQFTVTRHAF
ncbi:VOC family protein [Paenibacillus sp. SGZ-1009]|uniref:VOC family protein n=1 Tax=Paenibacillus campi TaxID=3106031 RepID=UPI003A4C7796